jgi:ribulose-phosphate 3-epimerase
MMPAKMPRDKGTPSRGPKLAPSILSADFGRLADAVSAAEDAGADWIHVDVMDGHFVPNLTFGPKMVADLRKASRLPLDVHLMIERPEDWVARYVEAGATYVTVHIEATRDAAGALDAIRKAGARPGIALNPETDVARLMPYVDGADLVLVMSVHPGFGGQVFIPSALDKVRALRVALDGRGSKAELEVDGGIRPENAPDIVRAGASVLVAGSAVYVDADGVSAALAKFRKALA